MNCKKCNKIIDCIDYQGYCQECYKELFTNTESKKNLVASLLKLFSFIIFIVVVIGSIIIMNDDTIIGVICLICSMLLFALLYSIGEIMQLLEDIKNNIKKT